MNASASTSHKQTSFWTDWTQSNGSFFCNVQMILLPYYSWLTVTNRDYHRQPANWILAPFSIDTNVTDERESCGFYPRLCLESQVEDRVKRFVRNRSRQPRVKFKALLNCCVFSDAVLTFLLQQVMDGRDANRLKDACAAVHAHVLNPNHCATFLVSLIRVSSTLQLVRGSEIKSEKS